MGAMGTLVSTHSRLKAAGLGTVGVLTDAPGFNTQPPEGGWANVDGWVRIAAGFNTQPPEGGWGMVSVKQRLTEKCFNTQPPEGGWQLLDNP